MLLTSGNHLSLSVVILLTLGDGLWSVPRMVSRLARHPRSSSKLFWLFEALKVTYTLHGIRNRLSDILQTSMRISEAKLTLQASASFLHTLRWSKPTLRASKSFLHALRWSKWILHALRIIKIDSLNFYKANTRFAVIRKRSLWTSTSPCYMLYRSQNRLSEPLQVSHAICGGQNRLRTFRSGAKTDSLTFSKPSLCFAVV